MVTKQWFKKKSDNIQKKEKMNQPLPKMPLQLKQKPDNLLSNPVTPLTRRAV